MDMAVNGGALRVRAGERTKQVSDISRGSSNQFRYSRKKARTGSTSGSAIKIAVAGDPNKKVARENIYETEKEKEKCK